MTGRGVQLCLGVLWLIDGLLQLQPKMFSLSFANQVIATAAQGQPGIIAGPVHFNAQIILTHTVLFNAVFALIQLALGVLILVKRTSRVGLIASVVWALGVWTFGEGLGGLLGLQTSLLLGAPGAALLYAILALAVMPGEKRPAYWLPISWVLLWLGGALYQLLPGQSSAADIGSVITQNASGAPVWLATLDRWAGSLIHGQGPWLVALLVVLELGIGLLMLVPGRARAAAVALGVVLSFVFWVFGQSLGAYYTGLATDPNSAPLFVLLGIACLGCLPLGFKALAKRAEDDLSGLLV
jgi:hypothetical protein